MDVTRDHAVSVSRSMRCACDINCLATLCMLCSLDMHGRCAVTLYMMLPVCFVEAANKLVKPWKWLMHFKDPGLPLYTSCVYSACPQLAWLSCVCCMFGCVCQHIVLCLLLAARCLDWRYRNSFCLSLWRRSPAACLIVLCLLHVWMCVPTHCVVSFTHRVVSCACHVHASI